MAMATDRGKMSRDGIKQRLIRALDHYESLNHRPDHRFFLEVDVSLRFGPEELVNRQVRIFWTDDEAWYLGVVESYDRSTARHRISYEDGTVENVILALERVRLIFHAGQRDEYCSPNQIREHAMELLDIASRATSSDGKKDKKVNENKNKRTGRLLQKVNKKKRGRDLQVDAKTDKKKSTKSKDSNLIDIDIEKLESKISDMLMVADELEKKAGLICHTSEKTRNSSLKFNIARNDSVDFENYSSEIGDGRSADQSMISSESSRMPVDNVHSSNTEPLHPYRIGDIIWAKVNGFPPWPSIVVTKEHASNGSVKLKKRFNDAIPLLYFGTLERQMLKPAGVTSFRDGVDRDYYVARTIKRRAFASSLCEVIAYLEDGEVPEGMFPSNDDQFDEQDGVDESEEEEEDDDVNLQGKRSKKGKVKSITLSVSERGLSSELRGLLLKVSEMRSKGCRIRVGNTLEILSLGRIEWLHPAYHNEKYIWPVGYKVAKTAVTPYGCGSSSKPVVHLCEIVAAPDGSGPLFRVSPKGKPPVYGTSPVKAWMALFSSTTKSKGPDKSRSSLANAGNRMFGLSLPPIQEAIESLKGAEYCEKYCWPDGHMNANRCCSGIFESLGPTLQRLRLAAEAQCCSLPPEIRGMSAPMPPYPGACNVCFEEEEDDEDLMLQCDACKLFVHMSCYGVESRPSCEKPWLCDVCLLGNTVAEMRNNPSEGTKKEAINAMDREVNNVSLFQEDIAKESVRVLGTWKYPACILCPAQGGMLKRTTCGRWAHPACALWLPETALDRNQSRLGLSGLISGVDKLHASRMRLVCQVCRQQYGACLQCCHPSCYSCFHLSCARNAGYLSIMHQEDYDNHLIVQESLFKTADVGSTIDHTESSFASITNASSEAMKSVGSKNESSTIYYSCDESYDQAEEQLRRRLSRTSFPNGCFGCKDESQAAISSDLTSKQQLPKGKRGKNETKGSGFPSREYSKEKFSDQEFCKRELSENVLKKADLRVSQISRPRKRQKVQQGTLVGNIRLLVFCPRHDGHRKRKSRMKLENVFVKREFDEAPSKVKSAFDVEKSGALPPKSPSSNRDPISLLVASAGALSPTKVSRKHYQTDVCINVDDQEATCSESTVANPWQCGRAVPLGDMLSRRRGQRAPEALQAAFEKRFCVIPTPLTVSCGPLIFHGVSKDMKKKGTIKFLQERKITDADISYLVRLQKEWAIDDREESSSCGAVESDTEKCIESYAPSIDHLLIRDATILDREKEQMVTAELNPEAQQSSCQLSDSLNRKSFCMKESSLVNIASASDRFTAMKRSELDRVAPGKSGIHGWGAFARRKHCKGDMIIEYAGELVRPSVAEARERQSYDSLVGCGTYIFRLNAKECVDATKAGNLAHLLNHSCEPNCFSRSISIWDSKREELVDHIVIFAARDISAGEELTYDYRFSGEEVLRCDCGAKNCRGFVNYPNRKSNHYLPESCSNVEQRNEKGEMMVPKSLVSSINFDIAS